jgi:hypothetical protein
MMDETAKIIAWHRSLAAGHRTEAAEISAKATSGRELVTYVDAKSGAALSSENILHYSGWAPRKYKHRVTAQTYEGRGQVRIVDTKDDRASKKLSRVPIDTFDPLSAMAWVRSLDLGNGEMATAHVLDGTILLKVEVIGRGRAKLDPMPSVAHGLGVKPEDVFLLEGTLSRVDRYGVVRDDKRKYSFRAYMTQDDRKLLLAIETDMWLGVLRLILNRYDPPNGF